MPSLFKKRSDPRHKHAKRKGVSGVVGMVVSACCFPFARSQPREDASIGRTDPQSSLPPRPPSMLMRGLVKRGSCRIFTLEEMKKATNNFNKDLRIRVGRFVVVYRGFVDDGAAQLTIKHFIDTRGFPEFLTEMRLLSKLHHRHLVSLVGFCFRETLQFTAKILVYDDYMAHGSLHQHIHESPPLPWNLRLQICIGVARGLQYRHANATNYVIIHHKLNTENIFLDSNWDARIADFRLCKIVPEEGNHPVFPLVEGVENIDREKWDVYSFGAVLLEILCARSFPKWALPHHLRILCLPLDVSPLADDSDFPNWILYCFENGMVEETIGPDLQGKITPDCLRIFVETAIMCLAARGVDRPTMRDVIQNLEYALHLQQITIEEDVAPSTWSQKIKPKIVDLGWMNVTRGSLQSVRWMPPCQDISLTVITRATDDFHPNHRINTSGLHKGYILGVADTEVVMKLTTSGAEFKTEIMILSRLCHRNLIFLVGYCDSDSKMILVYDYMVTGILDSISIILRESTHSKRFSRFSHGKLISRHQFLLNGRD